jgi:hypothetical protein
MTVDAIRARIHAQRRHIVQRAEAQGIAPSDAPAKFPEMYRILGDLVSATWALTLGGPDAAKHNARFCTWGGTP